MAICVIGYFIYMFAFDDTRPEHETIGQESANFRFRHGVASDKARLCQIESDAMLALSSTRIDHG